MRHGTHWNATKILAVDLTLALLIGLPQPVAANTSKMVKAPVERWFASWAASPVDAHGFPTSILAPTIDAVSNQTIRQALVISHGGSRLRLRFSNEFGSRALHIGTVSVGYGATGSGMHRIPLTFGGARSAWVPAGAPMVSDPVSLPLPSGAKLEINIYLPDPTDISTIHALGLQECMVSGPGDFSMADDLPGATPYEILEKMTGKTFFARPLVSEVDVAGADPVRSVIAFGDSITDGQGSTVGGNARWPDDLAGRIGRARLRLAVVNEGIGGNQVVANGAGPSALARFDRDALAVPGASTIILFEGINDIGFSGGMIPGMSRPDVISASEIIQGYHQLIERAHARGLKIIGATMTPFEGSMAFTPAKEAVRMEANTWIRTSGAFDAVVDFDLVARDPLHPDHVRPDYDSADHIHLNDAGYAALASAIDLNQL